MSYGVIWPTFWDSHTGRTLANDVRLGHFEGGWLACYLMTCKHANILGAFALPRVYIYNDTGMDADQTDWALLRLGPDHLDFLVWDDALQFVWVKEMAHIRLNLHKEASKHDNRVIAAQRIYDTLPSPMLVEAIFARYGKELKLKPRHLKPVLPLPLPKPAPFEGPPKPLRKAKATASGTVQNSTVPNSTQKTARGSSDSGTSIVRPERRAIDRDAGEHPTHAYCSERYCVPRTLHDELQGQVGGANVSLMNWYRETTLALGDTPCTENVFRFWQTRFKKEIVPRLRVAGAVDMLPERENGTRPMDRVHARGRAAARTAPIVERVFTTKE